LATVTKMTKTKIVATIGPASDSEQVIQELLASGMDCVRINLSHGTIESHKETIIELQRARETTDQPLAIIADTRGPEVRTTPTQNETLLLKQDEKVYLVTSEGSRFSPGLFVDYSDIGKELNPGDEIIVGDGEISLKVINITEAAITCKALSSGKISGKKKVTIPGKSFPLPSVTDEDIEDLELILTEGVDWLALSFVRDQDDIANIRSILKDRNLNAELPIMAKIETSEAAQNVESIAREADGLMVARGDLAMAIGIEEVPFLQKKIIRLANRLAKPVVTATQMLETMVKSPSPTRAEITDVANAVLDGTDAVMLSGETAIGSYPVLSVSTMNKLAGKADQHFSHPLEDRHYISGEQEIAPEIGRAACSMAVRLHAQAIITSTKSGYTARLIARFRPQVQIIAVTPSKSTYNQLALVWGVTPLLMEATKDTDEMIQKSITTVREAGLVDKGDLVVTTAGVPFAVKGTTNLIKVNKV